ncbi:glycoside hydrolase family 97 protein [soil metagenome]
MIFSRTISALFFAALSSCVWASETLASPHESLKANFELDKGRLGYRLTRDQATLTEFSPIGITVNGIDRGDKLSTLTLTDPKTEKRHLELRLGKQEDDVTWREATLTASDAGGPRLLVDIRLFDDGLAYRYRLPLDEKTGSCRIEREESSVKPPFGSTVWTQDYGNAFNSCEGIWSSAPLGATQGVRSGPVTVELPDGHGFLFVSEAGNFGLDYSGAKYQMSESVRVNFAHDPQGFTIAKPNFVSPWRVVITAKDLNGLVNQSVIPALVPLPDPKLFPQGVRTEWCRPGRATWSFFTRGFHEGNAVKKDQEEPFLDIAKTLGFEYNLTDEGWYGWKNGGEDQWGNMADLVHRNGVGEWVWIYYPAQLNNPANDWEQMRTFLDRLVEIGVKGIEIDFMDSDSQERRRFYDTALRKCAERKLMVQFHGANIPTGESNTWPNEMTREGIYGLENNLWFGVPAQHYCALPFTRLVAGHGCFTPGYFGHRQELLKRSSWNMQLATMLAYNTSLLQTPLAPDVLTDALPDGSPQRDLMKAMPVSWDETRVLPKAKIGQLAPFARRKGSDWWITVLNGENPRGYTVDLSFLSAGSYRATIVGDDPKANDAWRVESRTVAKGDRLATRMREAGGFVVWLKAL